MGASIKKWLLPVHLIAGCDALLPFLDAEVSRALSSAMERNRTVFHWKERVLECAGERQDGIGLKLTSGAVLKVDAVLVAAGTKSNTDELNLPVAGVTVGDHGLVHVDEQYRTSAPHIYAAGDVIGFPARCELYKHAALDAAVRASRIEPKGNYERYAPDVAALSSTWRSTTLLRRRTFSGCRVRAPLHWRVLQETTPGKDVDYVSA